MPGSTPSAQLNAIVQAMLGRHDSLENLYAALKPRTGKGHDNEHEKEKKKG